MNWDLIVTLTGIMLFSYWFNYIMGGPLSDDAKKVDTKAILFSVPYWLAVRRLKNNGLYLSLSGDLINELSMIKDAKTKNQLRQDKRLDMYLIGREFFTWERSLLCPICLHWWLTLVIGVIFLIFNIMQARADLFLAAFIYLANHFLIRKIS